MLLGHIHYFPALEVELNGHTVRPAQAATREIATQWAENVLMLTSSDAEGCAVMLSHT